MKSSVLRRLYYRIQLAKIGKFNAPLQMDPFRPVWVDPNRITKFSKRTGLVNYRWLSLGEIESGDWDKTEEQFCDHFVFKSLQNRFDNDQPWENTEYYRLALENIDTNELEWGKFTDQDAIDEFFSELDNLYENIKSEGYKMNKDLKSKKFGFMKYILEPFWNHDEIAACIGRDGKFVFIDGRHRLSIAKILSINKVPTRVLSRHVMWVSFRNEVIDYVEQQQGGFTKHVLPHADLEVVDSEYPSDRISSCIVHDLQPEGEAIAELKPGISGYILRDLSNNGYDCYAFEPNEWRQLENICDKLNIPVTVVRDDNVNLHDFPTLLYFGRSDKTVKTSIQLSKPKCVITTLSEDEFPEDTYVQTKSKKIHGYTINKYVDHTLC